MRPKVQSAKENMERVAITNCSIQKRKGYDAELEIVAGSRSGIIQSPKKFCINESMLSSSMYSGAIDVATLVTLLLISILMYKQR